jgi:hypothetical protein
MLQCDVVLSNFAFSFNLRRYIKVLTGAITEHVRSDRVVLTRGLTEMMESADDSSGAGTIKRDRFVAMLADFFPSKTTGSMTAITRALEVGPDR